MICVDQCIIDIKKIISLDLTQCLNLITKKFISIKTNEKLLKISNKSVFLIKVGENCGTGFLVKLILPSETEPLYGLITNNHVIDSDFIKNNSSFKIFVNPKPENSLNDSEYFKDSNVNTKNININEDSYIFTSELIDITFIQLDEEFLKNSEYLFLDPDNDDGKEKESIYIFQYPKLQLFFASGSIESSSGINYFHTASTDNGSSGSPLLNENMKIIGVHKAGIKLEKEQLRNKTFNIATKFNIVKHAISTLYYKRYINDIKKAREPARKLNKFEKDELKKHGLKRIMNSEVSEYMYKCPYTKSALVMLFYRTNHGWYFTSRKAKEIGSQLKEIKTYPWILINPYKKVEEIISEFDGELEHQHELIITWLKLSELMYM